MKLWFLLFGSFAVLFGTPAILWWRATLLRRRKQMVDAIRVGMAAPVAIAKPVVLSEPPAPKGSGLLARIFPSAGESGEPNVWSRSRIIILTAVAAVAGLMAGFLFEDMFGIAAPALGAIAASALPTLYQARIRRKRLAAIEEQFPEALDCLSRSIRAGNAFSVAIELLCVEVSEPLQSEVQKLTREMALGSSLEDGLNSLISRVPLLEIRFFASAVLLQRETGGNLAEVIAKLASSLRERFKLRGQVKAASGQGRLTAAVLTVLPIAVLFFLRSFSPDYLNNLTGDPLGRNLLAGAAVLQVAGFLVMRTITRIEV